MEIYETGIEEVRIAALEKKVRDLEPLVRGITAELLDLKTFFPAATRQNGEHIRQEPGRGPDMQKTVSPKPEVSSAPPVSEDRLEGSTVIITRSAHRADAPEVPPEPAMARIMQPDGTMKLEPRFGATKTVDTSAGSERTRKSTFPKRTTKNP